MEHVAAAPEPARTCSGHEVEPCYDAVIVGAGPAGLMLAACLARWGYSVKHIDNRPEPTSAGRADGIQPRYLDLLRNMGLKSAIMSHRPARIREAAFWSPATSGPGVVRTGTSRTCPSSIGARYPFTACLHQGLIERVFLSDLEKRGVRVQRPWTIESFSTSIEDRNHLHPVLVELRHVDGSVRERVRAKYLYSGEGSKSSIRRQLGINFRRKDSDAFVWAVMDGVVKTDFPDVKMMCTVHSESGSIMIIPRENGMVRLYVQLASSKDPDWKVKGAVTEKDVEVLANKILAPYSIEWESVDWFSIYPIQQGVAECYSRDQRVFLGGDACHTHSPKAGQGMNTAFLDSVNLAWKIHAVEGGLAHRDLLKTYELERMPVAKTLIEFDNYYARLFSEKSTVASNGHDKAGGDLESDFTKAFKESCLFVSGYGVHYSANVLNWSLDHAAKSPLFCLKAGEAAPGRLFITADVTRVEDADLVHLEQAVPLDGSFRLFVFGGDPRRTCRALRDLSDNLRRTGSFYSCSRRPDIQGAGLQGEGRPHGVFLTFCVIFATERSKVEICRHVPGVLAKHRHHIYADDRQRSDLRGTPYPAHDKFGFGQASGGVVVVRPDGYIGSIVRLADGSGTADALSEYFSSFSPQGQSG